MVEWIPSLSVGCDQIDRQHQDFLRLCKALDEAVGSASSQNAIGDAVLALTRHTFEHFDHEEKWLVSIGYDSYDREAFATHVDAHNGLKRRLLDLGLRIAGGEATPVLAISVKLEVLDHMLKHDMRYKSYAADYNAIRGTPHAA